VAVFKLRSQNGQLRTDFDLLKENNQRLMDANASAGASFAALNQHAKHLNKQNGKVSAELSHYKQLLQKAALAHAETKEELKMKQSTYIAEVHSRLQYQKTMTKIVDTIQARCRDTRLVEDVLQMADECEEIYLNGPTSLTAPSSFSTPGKGDADDSTTSIVSRFKSFFG
jgi:predicted nuclease with TOPRIM domain